MSSDSSSFLDWTALDVRIGGPLRTLLGALRQAADVLRDQYGRVPLEAPGGTAHMPAAGFLAVRDWLVALHGGACAHCPDVRDAMLPVSLALHDDAASVVAACAGCGRCASTRVTGAPLAALHDALAPSAARLEDGAYWRLAAPSSAIIAVLTECTDVAGAALRPPPPAPQTREAGR